jgi:hypothetical protein
MMLADAAACPGVAEDGGGPDLADVCIGCRREAAFRAAHEHGGAVYGVVPAAEWSDTTNSWRCGNRLPMEG